MLRLLAAALLLATPALAQPKPAAPVGPEAHASLLQRTPALSLAAPPKPLTGPITIGGTGWGPFKRL